MDPGLRRDDEFWLFAGDHRAAEEAKNEPAAFR
jgi:hypothetical protein